jgi:hypothetical protein
MNLEIGERKRMIGTDSNHYRVVAESLAGEKEIDEQTFASLAVLSEKLERLKQLDDAFSSVAFSSAIEKLLTQKDLLTVS